MPDHWTTQQIRALIRQFTGQDNTLTIPRAFIEFTGDHLAALFLSQIFYWQDRTTNPEGWFYKTADEWHQELCLSNFQIKRATAILKPIGLETHLYKVNGAPRTHYRIDFGVFSNLFLKFLENQETRKSRNYNIEIQETSKTMVIQETSKTIDKETKITHETTDREYMGTPPLSHPAVALYQQAFPTVKLTKKQAASIRELVGDGVEGLECWQETVRDYELSPHWKPENVGNLLHRCKNKLKERASSSKPQPHTNGAKPPQVTRAMDLDAMLGGDDV